MECTLNKSLYGLKQALRQWYKKFEGFAHKEGFFKCNVDHCCFFKRYDSSYIILLLYVDYVLVVGSNIDEIKDHYFFFKRHDSSYIILLLYVDYVLVIGSNIDEIKDLKMQFPKEFDIKDLGPAKKNPWNENHIR